MKIALFITLLFCSIVSKAQNAAAYAYYTAFGNTSGTDFYVFTSPKAFKYIKGSIYVFAPVTYEELAKKSIEAKVKTIDPSWTGLYVNQAIENVSMSNYNDTRNEIEKKMKDLYQTNQSRSYRGNAVKIIMIDMETAQVVSELSLNATSLKNNNGSAGNAN